MLWIWFASSAFAMDADSQDFWNVAFGATRFNGQGVGLGIMRVDTDLFEQVDPAFEFPVGNQPALTASYWGIGGGVYFIEFGITGNSPVKQRGAIRSQMPLTTVLSMGWGLDPIGLAIDDTPFGVGGGLALHAGAQGWQSLSVDKVGGFDFAEIGHVHMGLAVMPWFSPAPGLSMTGGMSWMPGRKSNFTMGKFRGSGAFDPAQQITLPPEYEGGPFAALIELENQIVTDRDFAMHLRCQVGLIGLEWAYRRVHYVPKSGSGVDTGFSQWTHTISVQLTGESDG